ncbi:flagellar biosynthesis protein FlaG [Duganella sp. FT80W]|uniref:Flagellar biosynthesis protein FlaG n=1 Tax=Duganella guangzhouensis TaxID=2666084 RepID=A0A6I2L1X3_9BURK|nr:flagellar protein FlaG [Duganella guangzhouensis]MRW91903.1 flagellar biosynthesis protein FlaG [Duganella guangzhouensis]
MDLSSITRLDTLPAASASSAAASVPASVKTVGADSAQSIVAAKEDSGAKTPSKTELKKSVDEINRFLQNNSEVEFSIDEASGLSVVKVIDTETNNVLRQLPSEQSLEIAKNLNSTRKGLLIDSKV